MCRLSCRFKSSIADAGVALAALTKPIDRLSLVATALYNEVSGSSVVTILIEQFQHLLHVLHPHVSATNRAFSVPYVIMMSVKIFQDEEIP